MTVKTSISPTDDQEAYARSLVESGQYPSLSAVLQRGLDMLRRESEMRDAELAAPRSLIDQRRAGGFVDIAAGEAETRAMLTRKRIMDRLRNRGDCDQNREFPKFRDMHSLA